MNHILNYILNHTSRFHFFLVLVFSFFAGFFGEISSASAQIRQGAEVIDFFWVVDGQEVRATKGTPRLSPQQGTVTLKIRFKTPLNNIDEKQNTNLPLKYIWYEFIAPRPVITDIFRANEGKTKTQKIENQDFHQGQTTKEGINTGMWVVRILYRNRPLIYRGKVFQPKVIIQ